MSNAFFNIDLKRVLAKYIICNVLFFVFAKSANFDKYNFCDIAYR